ncbi:ATP phosphoribosyltransferase regulatory subunit [uncultured Litoreibacter sp.]|uniref:ATP phosphoribosyltransferase regulatory subunit n=1 Tax=uncultured Litoreibacter sp. TaxID=1392394 RepID=UPI00260F19B1|nr:ATP phosphoribosyltransferase regulatory subunit [uncultured Litoreibacter sp.]
MPSKSDIKAEAMRLYALFQEAGAQIVEADLLQPSDLLLDLYGEEIRARAYVTSDAVLGEQMLRPDFTVPIVQAHMEDGAEPARYTYMGEVFRKQEAGTGRASEYTQVGYEVFDRADPASADAEVFALFSDVLKDASLQASIGDIGILIAAVQGLTTSERRRAALMRHIWRPKRFRALLDRFAGQADMPDGRAELIGALEGLDVDQIVQGAGPEIGLRSAGEVSARLNALREDMQVAPIPQEELNAVSALLAISADAAQAAGELADIANQFPAIKPAAQGFAKRLNALKQRGVDVEAVAYEGSYGRTSMEYYDGFVFGFAVNGAAPVASGGRYDALTHVLGQGREIPAVGGVIRPELLLRVSS